MAGWFDEQNVDGYRDWLMQERNLEGGSRGVAPDGTPLQTQPGMTSPDSNSAFLPETSPAVAAPFAQVDTGGGKYPLSSVAGEGFMRPWTSAFTAPTYEGLGDNPAFQFRMNEGNKAIQASASAKGVLGTARPMKEMMRWGQGLASEEYDKVYNRALGEYRMAHDIYKGNQGDQWNRLSGMAGTGQSAANTLGAQGTSYAGQGADLMTGAGNANAAGRVGSANAWNQGMSSIADNAMMLALLNQQRGGGYPYGG